MKQKLQRVCLCIIFILTVLYLCVMLTYVFRRYERGTVIGIKEEKALDMVYIGGSTVLAYWQPLKAWNDCGFTSYDFATNAIQPEMLQYCVDEVLKFQDPELLVIGIRTFLNWNDIPNEGGLRNVSDAMDIFSLNRIRMVNAYMKIRNKDKAEEELPYYFDIIKYHSNYVDVMANPSNWELRKNIKKDSFKGWHSEVMHKVLELPEDFQTSERAELEEECAKTLQGLLDTCRESGRQVLFVVSPSSISKKDMAQYNTMKDMIEDYGFQYLNANEYYEEMGVDFSRDFTDWAHVNCLGAEKYTEFLEEYIERTYDLPDHRGEEQSEIWNEEYEMFSEFEESVKKRTEALIRQTQEGIELAETMRNTEDVFEWGILARNTAFQIVIASKGEYPQWDLRYDSVFQNFGIDVEKLREEKKAYAALYVDGNLTSLEKNERDQYECQTGALETTIQTGDTLAIRLGEKQYSMKEDGVCMLVVDKNLNRAVDCVILREDEAGELKLSHVEE